MTSFPSDKIVSSFITLSRVTPNWIEVVPDELLPTMPPTIHRLLVEVFGPKNNP